MHIPVPMLSTCIVLSPCYLYAYSRLHVISIGLLAIYCLPCFFPLYPVLSTYVHSVPILSMHILPDYIIYICHPLLKLSHTQSSSTCNLPTRMLPIHLNSSCLLCGLSTDILPVSLSAYYLNSFSMDPFSISSLFFLPINYLHSSCLHSVCLHGVFLSSYRLVGLVVKASASKVEDPGFKSRWRFFRVESYQ